MVRFIIRMGLDIVALLLYLHSNMVRFIMKPKRSRRHDDIRIYIPIWLDLLLIVEANEAKDYFNLHSNMVRFIIDEKRSKIIEKAKFTFQYGQIYYRHSAEQQIKQQHNLHSNMVRFIMNDEELTLKLRAAFTFQYGQIYYPFPYISPTPVPCIYIPIWLDLLSDSISSVLVWCCHLHSNMVRFIIYLLMVYRLQIY